MKGDEGKFLHKKKAAYQCELKKKNGGINPRKDHPEAIPAEREHRPKSKLDPWLQSIVAFPGEIQKDPDQVGDNR
jgi:hypothetical protein